MPCTTLLLALAPLSPAPQADSLLCTVPEDARVLVHCRDLAALRSRAELNDWYRLLGTPEGEPALRGWMTEFGGEAHTDMDGLLALAAALEGEAVFFDTGAVAGFVTDPRVNRTRLVELMRAWLPRDGVAAQRTVELDGGTVEVVGWPDELNGWAGRAGHFAAFVDHPRALALYSGDSAEEVLAAVQDGVGALGSARRAPLVSAYLANGGGASTGLEAFVDFTPLVDDAEAALKQAFEGVLPDPTDLLGLEAGTWLHASADVFPGTRVDCRARLHVPPDTLAARLADTFTPLPHALPANLPGGVWALWALNWDVKLFYARVRAAWEEAGRGAGLEALDAGREAAASLAGIDPVVDVLNQLAGDMAYFLVEPRATETPDPFDGDDMFRLFGAHAGLVDGDAFLSAFETLLDVPGLAEVLTPVVVAGVDSYLFEDEGDIDGGIAILPRAVALAPMRGVLERSLRALTRVEGASLVDGSRMQAALDENAGACIVTCVELTPLRVYGFPELGDVALEPLGEGRPARDPFDAQLVGSARRTKDGFELRLHTR